ncbi:hypothetical protein AB0H87_05875, partial [Asanoa sp. NPDC050611]
VTNKGGKVTEFYVYAAGDRVMGEVENITPPRRDAFVALVRDLPGHWIAVETADVLDLGPLPAPPDAGLHNVVSLDGRPLAYARSHGQAMTWFALTP